MNRHALLRTTCVLLALLCLPLVTACEYRPVTIRIADFESALVEGVRFWRMAEANGDFEPGGSIEFSEPEWMDGHEVVQYTVHNPSGSRVSTLPAEVIRDAANPDMVTLEIQYLRFENPGWFRITTFNAIGESPLSNEQVYL